MALTSRAAPESGTSTPRAAAADWPGEWVRPQWKQYDSLQPARRLLEAVVRVTDPHEHLWMTQSCPETERRPMAELTTTGFPKR